MLAATSGQMWDVILIHLAAIAIVVIILAVAIVGVAHVMDRGSTQRSVRTAAAGVRDDPNSDPVAGRL